MNENDVKSNRKLCLFHFVETDFIKGATSRLLKLEAIQTIFEDGPKPSSLEDAIITDNVSKETCERNNTFSHVKTPTKIDNSDLTSVLVTPVRLKRKYYVGDIEPPEFATPKRAKRFFNKARLQIMTQIKVLHQTVRRLRNKLTSLKNLLEHLKSINLISEEAHDDILYVKYYDCCVQQN